MSQSGERAVLALNDVSPYEAISNFPAGSVETVTTGRGYSLLVSFIRENMAG